MSTQPLNKAINRVPLANITANSQPPSFYRPPSANTVVTPTTATPLKHNDAPVVPVKAHTTPVVTTIAGRKRRVIVESQSGESQSQTDENAADNTSVQQQNAVTTAQSLPTVHEVDTSTSSADAVDTSNEAIVAEIDDVDYISYLDDSNDDTDDVRARDRSMPQHMLKRFKRIVNERRSSKELSKKQWSSLCHEYVNLGADFYALSMFNQCIRYMRAASEAMVKGNDQFNRLIALQRQAESYEKLGKVAIDNGQTDLAIKHFTSGIAIANDHIKVAHSRFAHDKKSYKDEAKSHYPNACYIKACILLAWSSCVTDKHQAAALRQDATVNIEQANVHWRGVPATDAKSKNEKQLIYCNIMQLRGDIILADMNALNIELVQLRVAQIAEIAVTGQPNDLLTGKSVQWRVDDSSVEQSQLIRQRNKMLTTAAAHYLDAGRKASDDLYKAVYKIHEADVYAANYNHVNAATLYNDAFDIASASENIDEMLDAKYEQVLCLLQAGQYADTIRHGSDYNGAFNRQDAAAKQKHRVHAKNIKQYIAVAQQYMENDMIATMSEQYSTLTDTTARVEHLCKLTDLCGSHAAADHHRLWHVEQAVRCYNQLRTTAPQLTDMKQRSDCTQLLMHAYSNLHTYCSEQLANNTTPRIGQALAGLLAIVTTLYKSATSELTDTAAYDAALVCACNYAELQFNNGVELKAVASAWEQADKLVDQHATHIDTNTRISYKHVIAEQLQLCYQLLVDNTSESSSVDLYREQVEISAALSAGYKKDLQATGATDALNELNRKLTAYMNTLAITNSSMDGSQSEDDDDMDAATDINDATAASAISDDNSSDAGSVTVVQEPQSETQSDGTFEPVLTEPRAKRARVEHVPVDQAARIRQDQRRRKAAAVHTASPNLDDMMQVGEFEDSDSDDDRVHQQRIDTYIRNVSPSRYTTTSGHTPQRQQRTERISAEERELRQSNQYPIFGRANRVNQRRPSVTLFNAPRGYNQYANQFLGERVINTDMRARTMNNARRMRYQASGVSTSFNPSMSSGHVIRPAPAAQQQPSTLAYYEPVSAPSVQVAPVQPVNVYNTYNMFPPLQQHYTTSTQANIQRQASSGVSQSQVGVAAVHQPASSPVSARPAAAAAAPAQRQAAAPQYGTTVRVTVANSTTGPFDISVASTSYKMTQLFDLIDAKHLELTGRPIKCDKVELQNTTRRAGHYRFAAHEYTVVELWLDTTDCNSTTVPHVIAYGTAAVMTMAELFVMHCNALKCTLHPVMYNQLKQSANMTATTFDQHAGIQTEHYIAFFRAAVHSNHHSLITTLDFSHTAVRHEVIVELASLIESGSLNNVNEVKLSSTMLPASTLSMLLAALDKLQHLQTLELSNTAVNDTHVPMLHNLLRPRVGGNNTVSRSLSKLDLGSTKLTGSASPQALAAALCASPALTQLSMSHCPLSLQAIGELLTGLQSTNVTTLELGYLSAFVAPATLNNAMLTDSVSDSLRQLLTPAVTLMTQDSVYCRRRFTHIDLSAWPDTDNMLTDTICSLLNNKTNRLHTLVMRNNILTPHALNRLFDTIEHNDVCQLRVLDISHNIVPPQCKHALMDMVQNYRSLEQCVMKQCCTSEMQQMIRHEWSMMPEPKPQCKLIM